MTARMLAAIESPHTDILGHCTGRIIVGRGRPQSTFDAQAVFAACARTGTAVEINSRPERQDPPEDLLRLAVELGCSFAIDTDAHAPGQLEWLGRGCRNAVAADVPFDRVVNRSTADEPGVVGGDAREGRMKLPVEPPVAPMLAKLTRDLPATRPVLRAQMGRLPLHRLPRRRRRGARQPQREAADSILSRARRRAPP